MKKIKTLGISLAVASTLFIGCGGGESSGNTSGPSLSSNAVAAEPTLENGKKAKDAVAATKTSGILSSYSVGNDSKLNAVLLSKKITEKLFERAKDLKVQSYSLNETINETEECEVDGTVTYSWREDSNSGSSTVTYNNCVEYGEKTNGSIYITVKNYNDALDEYKDTTTKFTTDFTITKVSDNLTTKIFANSYITTNVTKFNSYGGMEDYKLSTSFKATDGTKSYGLEDCEYYFAKSTDLEMYQTKGRVYIDNLTSYIDYDTSYDMSKTPFVFTGATLKSGEARYNMSNNGKLKILVESNEVKAYVDADGDGTYELSE